jgi:arabinogalactan endo-1,4-beta-galactosidase
MPIVPRIFLFLFCLALIGCSNPKPFIRGADLSILKEAQDHGVVYRANGATIDPIIFLKQSGCNYVRLRLFVEPSGDQGQVNSLAYTLALARRVKSAGLPLLLDLHYSDQWADAQHQEIPSSWSNLTHGQLVQQVHDYTAQTLHAFAAADCLPDMLAIGNEISNGMLWPDGGPLTDDTTTNATKWDALVDLLKAGTSAARETAPPNRLQIMIHLDKGANPEISEEFFGHCQSANLDFDVIGLSYYPYWQASLEDLRHNLDALSLKYRKDIIIAETDFNYTGDLADLPYPATPAGQQAYLQELIRTVKSTTGGRGRGIIYWEPCWIEGARWNAPPWSAEWEQRALFDENGNALPAISFFK